MNVKSAFTGAVLIITALLPGGCGQGNNDRSSGATEQNTYLPPPATETRSTSASGSVTDSGAQRPYGSTGGTGSGITGTTETATPSNPNATFSGTTPDGTTTNPAATST